MIDYWEVLMVLTLVAYAGVYIAPWVQKVHTWVRTIPELSVIMINLLIVGVLMVDILVHCVWGYIGGLGFA